MKKWFLIGLLFVFLVLTLTSCAPPPVSNPESGELIQTGQYQNEPESGPSRFVCHQSGQKIVDTQTLNGVVIERVSFGNYSYTSWVWKEELGTVYMPYMESVSCMEYR